MMLIFVRRTEHQLLSNDTSRMLSIVGEREQAI